MGRFYVPPEQVSEDRIIITGSDVRHIRSVLRHTESDKITVCSGGITYSCSIESITADRVITIINGKTLNDAETGVFTVLYQGLPKGDKMDLIIQKNVELGITRIVPVIMERTIVRIEGKDISKKCDRWNRIAMEAAKQCGRQVIPVISEPVSFKELQKVTGGSVKIMPYENEEDRHLKTALKDIEHRRGLSFDILIGPEGGISKSEAEQAVNFGFIPVSLGKRILRTETAGFFVTGCIAYEFESLLFLSDNMV